MFLSIANSAINRSITFFNNDLLTALPMQDDTASTPSPLSSRLQQAFGKAVYVRWGRKTCREETGSSLVYEGNHYDLLCSCYIAAFA